MANMGQFSPQVVLETGDDGKLDYQAAQVRKSLLAVSSCNAKKNPCWFDGDLSYILPKNSPQLAQIRKLIAEAPKKIPMHLEKGVYHIKTWVKPPAEPAAPFARQGS